MRRHSPYNHGNNNPIRFIDPDGMFTIEGKDKDVNNGQATYTRNQDGSITWTNATVATEKLGNAMLKTSVGTEVLDNLINSETNFSIVDNTTDVKGDKNGMTLGLTEPTSFSNKNGVMSITTATITVYEKAIQKMEDQLILYVDHGENNPQKYCLAK